jgi:hypothetical protein
MRRTGPHRAHASRVAAEQDRARHCALQRVINPQAVPSVSRPAKAKNIVRSIGESAAEDAAAATAGFA